MSWNRLAHDVAFAEDQFLTFKGQRALAMMHLAMHDALNAILPVYETYAYRGGIRPADPIAATAQAAHDVLASQYPTQQAALADELARWLGVSSHAILRERGITLGREAAAAVLAQRDGDKWDSRSPTNSENVPVVIRRRRHGMDSSLNQDFGSRGRLSLDYPHQFRPAPPPPLRTKTYARALHEVQEYGAAASTRRTNDQTDYAIWWMEFAEGSVNRLARQLSSDRQAQLWPTARMFAQVAVALYDAYVATWDAKDLYDHWRPFTAIRGADADDNPQTVADVTGSRSVRRRLFQVLLGPRRGLRGLVRCAGRYVRARSAVHDGDDDGATRHADAQFDGFAAAAAECADSRVRLGWHFRYATNAGLELGERIAKYTMTHTLRVRSHRDDDKDSREVAQVTSSRLARGTAP